MGKDIKMERSGCEKWIKLEHYLSSYVARFVVSDAEYLTSAFLFQEEFWMAPKAGTYAEVMKKISGFRSQ
jgi:hypothetical protein